MKYYNANVFLPGCLGPVNREVALADDVREVLGVEQLVADTDAAQLEGLRALRLYHWQAVLRLRSYAADADMRKSDSEHYNKRANFHLKQVQLLNDFFPIGDTAEHDNATNL